MRTTIDINDALFKRVKVAAAINGISLKEFITRAVERELESSATEFKKRRVQLPLVPSKKPCSLRLSGADIAAVLEGEDLHALT